MPPLRGVFHSAGVLDDGAITQQTWDRVPHRARRRRSTVRRHLARADGRDAARPLRAVLVASPRCSARPGRPTTPPPTATSTRSPTGGGCTAEPALSINWGAWAAGRCRRRSRRRRARRPERARRHRPRRRARCPGPLMDQPAPQVGVTPIDWPVFLQRYPAGACRRTSPSSRRRPQRPRPSSPRRRRRTDVRRRLDEAPPHRRDDILLVVRPRAGGPRARADDRPGRRSHPAQRPRPRLADGGRAAQPARRRARLSIARSRRRSCSTTRRSRRSPSIVGELFARSPTRRQHARDRHRRHADRRRDAGVDARRPGEPVRRRDRRLAGARTGASA